MHRLLFPDPPRHLPADRWWRVALRTVHIVAMALLLGGIAYGVAEPRLHGAILATLLSGVALALLDAWKSLAIYGQGSGLAVLLKLILLGCGNVWPRHRLAWYLAATAIASIGAHMPGRWRHAVVWGPREASNSEGDREDDHPR